VAASAVIHPKTVATAESLSGLVGLKDEESGGWVEEECESVLCGAEGVSDDHTVVVVVAVVVQWEAEDDVG
jgi:hypothetical protein